MQTGTGTAVYNKFNASTGTSKQKQTTINTRIICRYNYLITNYNHFETIRSDLQFGWTWSFFVLLFLRRSSFFHRDLLSQPHPQLFAHIARQHFNRNVSKPVYHYWLNSWLVYSISLTCTSNCTWLRSCKERNLAQQSIVIDWFRNVTSKVLSRCVCEKLELGLWTKCEKIFEGREERKNFRFTQIGGLDKSF